MQMLFMRENHPGVGYSLISRSFLLGWKHARLWCETRESSTHFAAVKFFLSICDVCDISDFPSLRANESKFWFNRGHLKQNTVMCIAYIKGYLSPCDASTTDHSFNVISHWWLMQGCIQTIRSTTFTSTFDKGIKAHSGKAFLLQMILLRHVKVKVFLLFISAAQPTLHNPHFCCQVLIYWRTWKPHAISHPLNINGQI